MTAQVLVSRKSLEPFLKDEVEYKKHQVDGIRHLYPQVSFLLADDMGLGKSLQALTIFCMDVKMGKATTLVIVCPTTLRENWAQEIQKFTRLPYVLLGEVPHPKKRDEMKTLTPKARQEQLLNWLGQMGPRILICNYEQLASEAHKVTFARTRFDAVIFDEAHMMKNPKAQRTKAALALPSKRSFILTGTPMLNQVDELWTLLHRIAPKEFPSYWAFVNRYCVFGGYEGRKIVGVKNQTELTKTLGRFMLRRMKDDVLDRTKPTYIKHMLPLTTEQRKLYDQVKDELEFVDGSGVTQDTSNDLTKFLRLKQICNTPYSIDKGLADSSFKLDRVIERSAEVAASNDKYVLFTQFRGTQDAVVERLTKLNAGPIYTLHGDTPKSERVPTVSRWGNEKGAAFIVCMTQVAGVGLNMVQASNCGFVDKLFVPGLNKQAVDRLDRIGQTRPIVVDEFLTKGTVESRIEQILKTKEMLNADIVEGGVGMSKLIAMLKASLKDDL